MPLNAAGLSPETRSRLMAALAEAGKQGIKYNATSGWRSAQRGRELWSDRANNPYPVAPPGTSRHESGEAVDIVLADEKQRAKFTAILKSHGFTWGGDFKRSDPIHYEYRAEGVLPSRASAPAPGYFASSPKPAASAPKPGYFASKPKDTGTPAPGYFASRPESATPVPGYFATKPAAKPPAPKPQPQNFVEALVTGISERLQPGMAAVERGMSADVAATSAAVQAAPMAAVRAIAPTAPVGKLLVRLNALQYPLNNIINSVLRESARRRKRKGGKLTFSEGLESDIQGLLNSHPWQQFRDALVDAVPGDTQAIARIAYHSRPEVKELFDRLHIDPSVVDFFLEIKTGALSGKAQHALTRLLDRAAVPLGRAAARGVIAAGEAAANRPKQNMLTRAVEALGAEVKGRPAYRGAMETMNRAAARNEAVAREAADVAEETRRVSQKYLKKGAKVRVTEPVTGRTVNRFDQFVADWLEAGAAGSRHEALAGGGVQVGRRRLKQVWAASTAAVPKRVQALRNAQKAEVETARVAAQAADEYRTLRGPAKDAPRFAAQQAKGARTLRLSGGALGEARTLERNIIAQARVVGQELQTARVELARQTTRAASLRGRVERLKKIAQTKRRDLRTTPQERRALDQALDLADQRALAAEARVETQRNKIAELQKTRSEVAGQLSKARANTEQTRVKIEAARQRAIATGKAAKKAKDAAARATKRHGSAIERQRLLQAYSSVENVKAGQAERRIVELDAIRAEAKKLGVKWEDVERIGQRWQKIADAQGKRLVELGLLDADTFARLRGVYLPRLYLLRSTNPRAAEELLRSLERAEKIAPEEARAVRQWLQKKTERFADDITPRTFDEVRELETFLDRDQAALGRIVEGSATPAMAGYAQKTARAIADAEGIAEIVKNPKFAIRKELSLAGESAPDDWVKEVVSGGETYLLNPAVAKYLAYRNNPTAMEAFLERVPGWGPVNRELRKLWVWTTRTAANNAVGNYWLGHSAAAIEGVRGYTLPAYAKAVKQVRAIKDINQRRKLVARDETLREFLDETDLAAEGGTLLPREAQQVGSGFGVEMLGQQLRKLPGKAREASTDLMMRDVEQAGRLTLFRSLREGGKSVDEAARITRAVMIDYSDIGPLRRLLEQSNALPFITFPTKAVFQLLNQGYRRPDLLNTWSGERLRTHLDQAADAEAERQGRTPVARERRATGQYGLFDFPLPGRYDELGRPEVLRSPLLAPASTLFGMTPGGDVADVVEERLGSAFPLLTTAVNVALNQEYNPFRKEYQEIVKPGSIPPTGPLGGKMQEGLIRVGSGLRTLIPQVRDAERVYQAWQGTSRYGGKPQDLAEAFAQSFLGVRVDARIGETEAQRKSRKSREGAGPDAEMSDALRAHWDWLRRGSEANPNFVPDVGMKAVADRYQDTAKVANYLRAANSALEAAKKGARYTGKDKIKAVKDLTTWVYTLRVRERELKGRDVLQSQPGDLPPGLLEYFQNRAATPSPGVEAAPP